MPENETITETTETPDPNKINAVGTFQGGKFVPYGYAGFADTGTPVYIFNTEDDYNAVADTLPDPSVIITLDDLDTGGFKFDSELNDESENAVQNKVIKAALDALRADVNKKQDLLAAFSSNISSMNTNKTFVAFTDMNCEGAPRTEQGFALSFSAGLSCVQLFVLYYALGGNTYIRQFVNGAWQEWKEFSMI